MRIGDCCIGCRACIELCPQNAIHFDAARKRCAVSEVGCMECGVCRDMAACPAGALVESDGEVATIRRSFGRMLPDPGKPKTRGRVGKVDLKTCDARGGIPTGRVFLRLELGRPWGRVRLGQAEELRAVLRGLGYAVKGQGLFESLFEAPASSAQNAEPALPERLRPLEVLSLCLECECGPEKVATLVKAAEAWARDSGVRLCINALTAYDGLESLQHELANASLSHAPRVKLNLGWATPPDGETGGMVS